MAIDTETWWRQETIPPTLAQLRSDLLTFWGIPSGHIGIKGDVNHRRGYHRSFAWIKNSQYATNRTYSTVETAGNRAPGDKNWLAALDISLDPARLHPMCRRLDAAVRSGRFEKVTEWYGTFDGKTVVGYNNVTNRPETSDNSHLFHGHLSFDRLRVGEDHTDLYMVLAGTEGGPDMATVYRAEKASGTEFWISDGISRRGPIRGKSPYFGLATGGMRQETLTEKHRTDGGYASWDEFLDGIAGPVHAVQAPGGLVPHKHDVVGETGTAVPDS